MNILQYFKHKRMIRLLGKDNQPDYISYKDMIRDMCRRILSAIRLHDHSIYLYCRECHTFGCVYITDTTCNDCGSTDVIEYYPTGIPHTWTGRKNMKKEYQKWLQQERLDETIYR